MLIAPLYVWSRVRNKTQTTWFINITSKIGRNLVLEKKSKADRSGNQMQFRILGTRSKKKEIVTYYRFIKKEQYNNTNVG